MAIRSSNGEMLFNPPAGYRRSAAATYLIVMGRPGDLRALETLLAGTSRAERPLAAAVRRIPHAIMTSDRPRPIP